MINPIILQQMQYIMLSLFCGWGGGDRGLHDAGFFTPWAVDFDKHARDCFKLNFPNTRIEGWDLFNTRIEYIMQQFGIIKGQLDMGLFACPCQGISSAGVCNPYHPLNVLFLRTLRFYIPALQSKTWIIENVTGLLEPPMAPFYNLVQEELDALRKEYDIIVVSMNSLGYGVPQARERVIILGVHRSLGVPASLPEPFTTEKGQTIADVLPYLDGIHYGYGGKKFKHKSGVCNTITKTPNIWARENNKMRDFRIDELLKLSGYPQDWKVTGSDNQLWNRIGNSIMPPFMQAIGEHVRVNILEKAGVPKQNVLPYIEANKAFITPPEAEIQAPMKKKPAQKKSNGYVVYQGPSAIDGKNIVAILTTKSLNVKTGDAPQLWILPADVAPNAAIKTGEDRSVCGDCMLRHYNEGACYVRVEQEPLTTWKAWKRGAYTEITKEGYASLKDRTVRLGAYGDPGALPMEVLMKIRRHAKYCTSYTHQWRTATNDMKAISMASVDNRMEQEEAVAKGWRTFRLVAEGEDLMEGEITCPAITHNTQCADCRLCSGSSHGKVNIAVPVHGRYKNKFNGSDAQQRILKVVTNKNR